MHAVPPGVYSALRARAAPAFIVPLRVQVIRLVHIQLLLDFLTLYLGLPLVQDQRSLLQRY